MASSGFDAAERVNTWIHDAFQRKASDIHVEHVGRSVRVRIRVDGTLERLDGLTDANVAAVFARLKVMAELDVNERRLPQDGRFRVYDFVKNVKFKGLDARVSVMAGISGEKAVVRLIDNKKLRFQLDELGFSPQSLARSRACIQRPYGLTLHVGPTGSGKSTSLYVATEEIHGPGLNLVTVEDPVEFTREGVLQAQVNPDVGLTYPMILRALLRQDPDIIMLGEIRDQETAEIALQAASTGHRVFSSLHTNDAIGTIARFRDMGLPGYKIADALQCVVSQRFVRKLCECRKPMQWKSAEREPPKLFRSAGCAFCKNTGFQGRSAVFEVLAIDERLRSAIASDARTKAVRKLARAHGYRTLLQEAWLKALAGVTSPAEVLRVTQGLEIGDQSTEQVARLIGRLLRADRGSSAKKKPAATPSGKRPAASGKRPAAAKPTRPKDAHPPQARPQAKPAAPRRPGPLAPSGARLPAPAAQRPPARKPGADAGRPRPGKAPPRPRPRPPS